MKKVFIDAELLCDRRKLDTIRISKYLIRNDYEIVDSPKKADVILIITCGFGNSLADIYFKKIKKFNNYDREVIVTGCLPDTDKKRFDHFFNGRSFSTKHIDEIEKYFPKTKVSFSEIEDSNSLWNNFNRDKISDLFKLLFLKFDLTKRAYVGFFDQVFKNKIGENHLILHSFYGLNLPIDDLYIIRIASGCWQNCSYCGIKKAVGDFKSKPLHSCLNEFKNGLEKGYSNFFLTAEDTGCYGLDINSNFPDLLEKMTNIDGEYRINIYALNPRWVVKYVDELEEIVKKGKIKATCIPVQSGNTRILTHMNRYSDVREIKSAFIRLKKANSGLALATHCIVGFPSETNQEFKETLDFIKETCLDLGIIMVMSIKTDTEAGSIEPQVSNKEIFKRMSSAQKYLNNSGYKTFIVNDTLYFGKKQ
ncbi:MAG: radical SAM protein [Candidatus Thermoplasmatota archaeon]|nr:radical SAM protein [Candidatus Thermoplasmatota archaeon]